MSGVYEPFFVITDEDHAGYVAVASYIFLVLMLFLVATRIFTRWYVVRYIKFDDVILVGAAFLAIAQSVLVQLAINHGLGRMEDNLVHSDFVLYQKYEYGAQILLIASIACAKISLSFLFQTLMAEGHSLWASRGLLVLIMVWAFTSMIALAFQCPLPTPWMDTNRCVNQGALHIAIGALNIATDLALIILPCAVFWKVHDRARRFRVTALFSTRIVAMVVTIMQLTYVRRVYVDGADKTWANINASIWDQIMMNISIICTAIPSLGRFIVELSPEVNAFAITERHGVSRRESESRYAFNSSFGHRFKQDYVLSNKLGVQTSVRGSHNDRNDSESIKGLREDGLQQNVIKQTVGFEIKYATET